MIELTIDGKNLSVETTTTVMEAALQLGISIPSMCHNGDLPHFASCMICMVQEESSGKLFTSCTVKASEGMNIVTMNDEIREARKTALDLLLSDHVGDCEAPCTITCPAHMNIPEMNRLLAQGKFEDAYQVVIQDIALPSILGRICPAPCEGACRRGAVDEGISICFLKRYAGDFGAGTSAEDRVETDNNLSLQAAPAKGRVAIIGSGPYGLSAAWYLQLFGYQCIIFDRNPLPGGALRYSVPPELLPLEVLEQEIERIRQSGVTFKMNSEIDPAGIKQLEKDFDAVVYPLEKAPKMAIKSSALGKEAAWKIRQQLAGQPVVGERRMFNSRFGRLMESEAVEYLKESVAGNRIEPALGFAAGMTADEVIAEAARCLHCECRKPETCLLRMYADEYGAEQKRFQGPQRKPVTKQFQHETVVYEPQKCIKCGICVRITALYKEEFGLTFIGRGFDVVIGVPFSESLREGLTHTAEEAANACPTGALAMKGGRK
ncbi:MAG: 2Fe-2S iron-sulfur cluster-binding protein [Bacteroidales bacterium]|jgi:ferredoxin